MKEIRLKISGMHCGSCEKIIQMDLSDIPGVIDSRIDAKTGSGLVKVEDPVSSETVIATIDKAGYKAKLMGDKIG